MSNSPFYNYGDSNGNQQGPPYGVPPGNDRLFNPAVQGNLPGMDAMRAGSPGMGGNPGMPNNNPGMLGHPGMQQPPFMPGQPAPGGMNMMNPGMARDSMPRDGMQRDGMPGQNPMMMPQQQGNYGMSEGGFMPTPQMQNSSAMTQMPMQPGMQMGQQQQPGVQMGQQQQIPGQTFPNFLGLQSDNMFAQHMFSSVSSQFLPEYGRNLMNNNAEQVKGFFRVPKPYFAVSNRYVLKKLLLILCPLVNKSWQRKRLAGGTFDNVDQSYERSVPREDINAPDLYIPVMALVSYVLLVGFISGTKGVFTPEKMGSTASLAIGVVTFEVLIVRLGFYLINARSAPWLDYIAFRGYKFVGLVVSLLLGSILRMLYLPVLLYCASMMGLFLIRTYRLILLPADQSVGMSGSETATRNYFLLFIALLQYPLFWVLSVRP